MKIPRRAPIAAVAVVAAMAGALAVTVSTPPAQAAAAMLSQNRTGTASSVQNAGTPASASVGDDATTRWSSAFSDPQWIQVDLASQASISQVVLAWEGAYATAYHIDVS